LQEETPGVSHVLIIARDVPITILLMQLLNAMLVNVKLAITKMEQIINAIRLLLLWSVNIKRKQH
jgi:hypothetical protein